MSGRVLPVFLGVVCWRGMETFFVLVVVLWGGAESARADGYDRYRLVEQFFLPAGAGPLGVLSDGRLVTAVGADLYVETASGTRVFAFHGSLPGADMSPFGPAFVVVSPGGSMIAIGNNGGVSFSHAQVGVFSFPSLTGVWFDAAHFLAAWTDDTHLALTAGAFGVPSIVTLLDTTSVDPSNPVNPTVIGNIGGASGGVAIDATGNLFTGNGFEIAGPSGTGLIKAFAAAQWMAAASGSPIDFETEGVVVVDVLSASPLGFDLVGNLLVGGGDSAAVGQSDYVAVVNAASVANALGGGGPVNVNDPGQVARLDPDVTNDADFFTFAFGSTRNEIYINDFGNLRTYVYRDLMGVPAVSHWGLVLLALVLMVGATLTILRWQRRGFQGSVC